MDSTAARIPSSCWGKLARMRALEVHSIAPQLSRLTALYGRFSNESGLRVRRETPPSRRAVNCLLAAGHLMDQTTARALERFVSMVSDRQYSASTSTCLISAPNIWTPEYAISTVCYRNASGSCCATSKSRRQRRSSHVPRELDPPSEPGSLECLPL